MKGEYSLNLVYFLVVGTIYSLILGEFGRFPFGGGAVSLTVYDLLLSLTVGFLLIWQIAIKKSYTSFKSLHLLTPFLSVALVSLIASGDLKGGLYLIRYLIYASSFWIGYCLVNSLQTSSRAIERLFINCGLILAILGLIQLVFFPDLKNLTGFGFDPHLGRLVSTFLDPNFLGSFLNISIAMTLIGWFKTKERKLILFGLVMFVAIILTFSRSAYLFLFTQVLVWSVLKNKKIFLIMIVSVLLLNFLVPKFSERIIGGFSIDKSSIERFISWKNGLVVFKDKPLLGAGFNNLRDSFVENNLIKTYSEDGGHAGAGVDSSLLFVMATTGIIGILSFLFFWIKVFFIKFSLEVNFAVKGVILGLLVSSTFINSLFYPPIMLIIYLWFGSLYAEKSK